MNKKGFSKLNDILQKYRGRGEVNLVIPVLQEIQSTFGYLPPEALKKMSRHYNIPLSHIYGVATFYTQFSLVPRGKNIITVCQGTACHIRGAPAILKEIERILGIKSGQTAKDLSFTLESVNCLGACAMGPMVVINGKYYRHMTFKKTQMVLSTLRNRRRGKHV